MDGYSFLISTIKRLLAQGYSHDVAVKKAVDTCIEKGHIADFLGENYKEVLAMLIQEYNEEIRIRVEREEEREEAQEEGMKKAIEIAKLILKGEIIDQIAEKLNISVEVVRDIKEDLESG